MALTYSLIIILASAILAAGFSLAKEKVRFLPIIRKIAVAALALVAFYRYQVEREAVYWVRGLNMTLLPGYEIPFGDEMHLTFLAVILIWFTWAALFTILMNEFYKFVTLNNIVKFFSVPVLLLESYNL